MKRFFCVFSIIMIVFLLLAACAMAVERYVAVSPDSQSLPSVGGWGITTIPFHGNTIVFPNGDMHIIQYASAQDVAPGEVVLFAGGSDWFAKSGYVESKTDTGFNITTADGKTTDEPAGSIKGIYKYRIPRLVEFINRLKSPLAMGVFAAALLASILLWRLLPGGGSRQGGALSESDEDIATILY